MGRYRRKSIVTVISDGCYFVEGRSMGQEVCFPTSLNEDMNTRIQKSISVHEEADSTSEGIELIFSSLRDRLKDWHVETRNDLDQWLREYGFSARIRRRESYEVCRTCKTKCVEHVKQIEIRKQMDQLHLTEIRLFESRYWRLVSLRQFLRDRAVE